MESEETGAHSVRESNGASILFKHCRPQASMERTNEPKLEREKKQHPILFILERERERHYSVCFEVEEEGPRPWSGNKGRNNREKG
jgi:hypothetical protein